MPLTEEQAAAIERISTKGPRWMRDARKAGYPLCQNCTNPIAPARWLTSDYCTSCGEAMGEMKRIGNTMRWNQNPDQYWPK